MDCTASCTVFRKVPSTLIHCPTFSVQPVDQISFLAKLAISLLGNYGPLSNCAIQQGLNVLSFHQLKVCTVQILYKVKQ